MEITMRRTSITTVALIVTLALILPATAQEPKVVPATDGIFAAFAAHPLVGIDDDHGLAQELDFYAAIIRDPRFARDVGNLVVETGSANNQAIIDAYVAGEAVPYTELRKVWTDPEGWVSPPALLGVVNLFATVRAVNAGLAPARRIRIWLGQPPVDWSKMNKPADLEPIGQQSDGYAGELILREIIARNKKALVIYGGQHFLPRAPGTPPDQPDNLRTVVERQHPGAFFVITPYLGGQLGGGQNLGEANKACLETFAGRFAGGPVPALAAPLKGGALEAGMRACPFALPSNFPLPPLPPTMSAEMQARVRANMMANLTTLYLGLYADALLWLGPPAGFTTSPHLPDYYLDADYRRELDRRQQVRGQRPLPILDPARNPASPLPR
jgi:hypothetical protein